MRIAMQVWTVWNTSTQIRPKVIDRTSGKPHTVFGPPTAMARARHPQLQATLVALYKNNTNSLPSECTHTTI